MNWKLEYLPEAEDDFKALDGSQRNLVLKAIKKVQQNPLPADENGYGKLLGNQNGKNLAGLLKIKLRAAGIRVVYQLQRTETAMLVIVIGVRADEEVYEIAQKRAAKHHLLGRTHKRGAWSAFCSLPPFFLFPTPFFSAARPHTIHQPNQRARRRTNMKLPKLPKLPSLKSLHLPSRITMERLLIVSAAALVVVLAVRGGQQTQTAMQQTDFTPDVSTQTIADASPDVEMTATVCWYEDGEGYLVPVTRQIPLQDGVAKATLSLMVKSSENDLAAARMGLRNVIPEGVTFDLDISGGKARVDLSKEALSCQNAEEELLMVQGTAAALCGFDTVQEVTFLFDGQKRSQLTHGTDVSGVFKADGVNLESVETTANLTNASRVQLYFPSADGRLMVPVTRTVFSPADLTTAMLELAKGPEKDSGLEIPLPKDCGLRSVTLKNGVATIDFTKEFASLATAEDASAATSQALRAIVFTASQFPGVKKVEVLVEGKPFEAQPSAVTTFVNQADEVMAQYPGLITVD